MELLKSPSPHLTVQKDLRLLNSGTLNRKRSRPTWGQFPKKRRWTIQKKSLHINTVYTEISDILTKIASKNVWENLSWIVQQADLRRLLQVKPVAIAVPGLSTTSSLSSSSGTSLPTSLPQESIGSTPIPALIECESADEQARGDPSRNPTNQAMST